MPDPWRGVGARGAASDAHGGWAAQVPASEVKEAQWLQVGSFGQLRLGLRGGASLRFDGFVPKVQAAGGAARAGLTAFPFAVIFARRTEPRLPPT